MVDPPFVLPVVDPVLLPPFVADADPFVPVFVAVLVLVPLLERSPGPQDRIRAEVKAIGSRRIRAPFRVELRCYRKMAAGGAAK